jgi:hypothetical protein
MQQLLFRHDALGDLASAFGRVPGTLGQHHARRGLPA